MHVLQCTRPIPALRRYIRLFAQRKVGDLSAPVVEPVPARLESMIEFPLGDPAELIFSDGRHERFPNSMVIGVQTHRRADVVLRGNIESFGVFFQPSGFSRLFCTPLRTLLNQAYEASTVVGAWIRELHLRLIETDSFNTRVSLVEAALLQHGSQPRDEPIFDIMDDMLAHCGSASVRTLASQHGLSLRHFERRFVERAGIPPKLYARIARFQSALDAKVAAPKRTWLEIAHDLNYHDQMHMIHDFRTLAGDVPSRVLVALGDMRPPALVLSGEIHSI